MTPDDLGAFREKIGMSLRAYHDIESGKAALSDRLVMAVERLSPEARVLGARPGPRVAGDPARRPGPSGARPRRVALWGRRARGYQTAALLVGARGRAYSRTAERATGNLSPRRMLASAEGRPEHPRARWPPADELEGFCPADPGLV